MSHSRSNPIDVRQLTQPSGARSLSRNVVRTYIIAFIGAPTHVRQHVPGVVG